MTPKTLKADIVRQMDIRNYTRDEAAHVLGMSRQAFYYKLREPERFTVRELFMISKMLGIEFSTTLSDK